jgi:phenylacetate-CoA ligase
MQTHIARTLYFSLQFLRREPIGKALADLEKTEFLPSADLKQVQASRMISQLEYALENVPHYGEHFHSFAPRIHSLSSWDQVNQIIHELPWIEKDDVQRKPAGFLSKTADKLPTHPDKTSGSTGTPLVFPCDQQAWAYRHALIFRTMRMWNVRIGEPYALFFGLHWNSNVLPQIFLRDWIFNRVRVSAFDIGRNTFESYLKRVRAHCPTFFLGYPSAIHDFCFLARDFGVDLRELKLKAIFTTAEPLLAHQRLLIEEITNCRCVNYYGSAEGGFNAFECPEHNLHLAAETTWLRLKGTSTNSGDALITDMMLRAFPLINYSIGDEVELKLDTCDCGRSHPLLETIKGRSGEPILLPNGRRINANLPSYIFKPLASLGVIRRYRFVQQGNDLKLYLVVSEKITNDLLQLVEQETKKAFGADISFTTHIVPEMETLPNAKHKCFVVLGQDLDQDTRKSSDLIK